MIKIQKQLLPNTFYNERVDKTTGTPIKIDMLVFHCSAYPTQKLIQVFKDLGVSAHYIIDTDGTITQLVDESKRAWHAGMGSWNGVKDINAHSIGIEIINPSLGHSVPYTNEQIDSLIKLSKKIIKKYKILPHNIFAHSDLAPTRKYDPGRLFPWEKLANEGIGLWPSQVSVKKPETDVCKLLSDIGYCVDNEAASLRAFLRHFMQTSIPDKENPQMEQYPFLLEYDKNLPEILKKQLPPNKKMMTQLNRVALTFKKSR